MSRNRRFTVRVAAVVSVAVLVGLTVTPASAEGGHGRDAATQPRAQFPAFVLDHGRFRSFESPDPTVSLVPGDVTNRGVIVGEYLTDTGESGFVRDVRGRVTRIDLPGAAGTQVDKINERGQIVGNFSRVSPGLPGAGSRGYVLDRGRVTRIHVPEATKTVPHGINDRGQVVGLYEEADGAAHGFLWSHGRFSTLDVPGATFTEPLAINDRGQIVGTYGDTSGVVHGFHLERGDYTTVDLAGATVSVAYDINDHGQIAFSAFSPTTDDPYAGARGFVLRRGPDGPFNEVRFPGAPRTIVTGINDQGRLVGNYENPRA